MVNPIKELDKAKKKGIFYPSDLAKSFIDNGKSTKQTVLSINRYFNDDIIDYKEVIKVNKEISKRQKSIENPTIGIREKQYQAFNSIVSTSLVQELSKESDKRQKAIWLPSSSDIPSIDHLKNYYEEFYLDEGIDGELPGERINCQCGYRLIEDK